MSKNLKRIMKLNRLVSLEQHKRLTVVLNPEGGEELEDLDEDIVYDKREWKIPKEYYEYIENLSKDKSLSTEDKILKIYEKIGLDYVYDDNLISYIKKVDDDVYTLPDWYAREADDEWEKSREQHNRRICFELSRYLAKSLTELLKDNNDYSVCIHWNKELVHYFVGLTCKEYNIVLDIDDFYNIKDVTRLKAGLTANGIKILDDNDDKFKDALKRFNKGRSKDAIKRMEHEVEEDEIYEREEDSIKEDEDIEFLKKSTQILAEKYKLDSQGIFEYMKEIVDIKYGRQKRQKIWKKLDGEGRDSTRYIRCLIVNFEEQNVLIDGDEKIVRLFDEEEFKDKKSVYIPYDQVSSRGIHEYYDGK